MVTKYPKRRRFDRVTKAEERLLKMTPEELSRFDEKARWRLTEVRPDYLLPCTAKDCGCCDFCEDSEELQSESDYSRLARAIMRVPYGVCLCTHSWSRHRAKKD